MVPQNRLGCREMCIRDSIKDMREQLLRNSRPIVAYFKDSIGVFPANREHNPISALGMQNRIFEQVGNHLFNQNGIHRHHQQLTRNAD